MRGCFGLGVGERLSSTDWGTPCGVAGSPSEHRPGSCLLSRDQLTEAGPFAPKPQALLGPVSGLTSPLSSAIFLSMLDRAPSSSSRSSDMRPSSSWWASFRMLSCRTQPSPVMRGPRGYIPEPAPRGGCWCRSAQQGAYAQMGHRVSRTDPEPDLLCRSQHLSLPTSLPCSLPFYAWPPINPFSTKVVWNELLKKINPIMSPS